MFTLNQQKLLDNLGTILQLWHRDFHDAKVHAIIAELKHHIDTNQANTHALVDALNVTLTSARFNRLVRPHPSLDLMRKAIKGAIAEYQKNLGPVVPLSYGAMMQDLVVPMPAAVPPADEDKSEQKSHLQLTKEPFETMYPPNRHKEFNRKPEYKEYDDRMPKQIGDSVHAAVDSLQPSVLSIRMGHWATSEMKVMQDGNTSDILFTGGVMNCLGIVVHNSTTHTGALAHYPGDYAAKTITLGPTENTNQVFQRIDDLLRSMITEVRTLPTDQIDIVLWKGQSFNPGNREAIDRHYSDEAKQQFSASTFRIVDLTDKEDTISTDYTGLLYCPAAGQIYFCTPDTDAYFLDANGFFREHISKTGQILKSEKCEQIENSPKYDLGFVAEEPEPDLFAGMTVRYPTAVAPDSARGANTPSLGQTPFDV